MIPPTPQASEMVRFRFTMTHCFDQMTETALKYIPIKVRGRSVNLYHLCALL
jgi:hypothetical protein